jgi:metal transporter CNNM
VLAGGVFAGLTLGLMGQDEVYLKVIATSGDPSEQRNSKKVLQLIDHGKHWVLVTLLLSNVITNETLPIVLDRVLGGGWPAVVSSTAAIVIFGEVIPQSVCVRYGLQIGAFFTPFVLALMYVMYPLAYPIAMLLDKILGEDHGTMYKKSGLKTLVTLHRTMGVERLNSDEVTIISAVLDLKEKRVSDIMTPMKNVFTMSSDAILDEKTVEEIFNSGFSRIPIHLPNEPKNFIGMLLVRVLISYDPEDALPVSSFPLATLPETPPDTSCLNILNYFQEGKSHMVVVSERPGDSEGGIGVLTLEDVIEELIGEEIVDESDVFIDIDRNIKRVEPGPLAKRHLTQYLHSLYNSSNKTSVEGEFEVTQEQQSTPIQFKPSNLASNPLETTKSFVTIKKQQQPQPKRQASSLRFDYEDDPPFSEEAVNVPLLANQETPLPRTDSPNYGSNRVTTRRSVNRSGSHQKSLPAYSNRGSFDLNEPNGKDVDGVQGTHAMFLSKNRSGSIENSEQHSFRTGGIIESVVNVQGVSKTIIESRPDDEDEVETRALLINTGVESHNMRTNRRMSKVSYT